MPANKRPRPIDEEEELERARTREALLNRSREESQKHLKAAGVRLQRIMQIAKARPFDETAAELRDLDKRHTKELEDLEKKYDDRINALRLQISALNDEIARRQNAVEKGSERKAVLSLHVTRGSHALKESETYLGQLSDELTQNSESVVLMEAKVAKAQEALEQEKATTDLLRQQLERAQQRADESTQSALQAQSAARIAQEDLDLLLAKTSVEMEDLKDQLNQLGNSPGELEAALREAFSEQAALIIEERTRQFEEENREGLRELKTRYARKWVEYDQQLETMEQGNENLREKLQELTQQVKDAKLRREPSVRLSQAIKAANLVQQQLDEANKRWSKLAAKNKSKLEQLRSVRNIKDREYDDLMDLKVALAMEIKAYSGLLANEEDRLGYVSPTKKRRR